MLNHTTGADLPLPDQFLDVAHRSGAALVRTDRQDDSVPDFARSVEKGLFARPRRLECRFLYDARGSELYERITEQPEYYPTRTEAAILAGAAPRIREIAGPSVLVELGSGSSVKTDHLLRAWVASGPRVCYFPVDVSESALRHASRTIAARHPTIRVAPLNSTYEEAFPHLRRLSPVTVVFLGSTIGNLDEGEAALFFRRLSGNLSEGDFFLLGADLVKEPALLEAAYNDRAGVTAAFTCNLFARMNRELGCTLDLSAIEHVARWRPESRRIEIHARFTRRQTIRAGARGPAFEIAGGEEILVEISRKFVLSELRAELDRYGLHTREVFTDERGWFALLLLEKTGKLSWQ